MRADFHLRRHNIDGASKAIELMPDQSKFYVELALLDPPRGRLLLERAVALNRYDSRAAANLALLYEANRYYAAAERLLLDAFRSDQTYLPRWALANFYFRRENSPKFWHWARMAAAMPADDIAPLLELCWRFSADPKTIEDRLPISDRNLISQYIRFLLQKNELDAAAGEARRLAPMASSENDARLMFSVIDRLVTADDMRAGGLWRLLASRGRAPEERVPYNGDFARTPLAVAFDWRISSYDGVRAAPGPAGLVVEFSGREPEVFTVAEQVVAAGDRPRRFEYRYRTANIAPQSGLHWQAVDAGSGLALATSADLSDERGRIESFAFPAPESGHYVRMRLAYERPRGATRIYGMVRIVSTRIEDISIHDLSQMQQ
jgi:hypothetical protein